MVPAVRYRNLANRHHPDLSATDRPDTVEMTSAHVNRRDGIKAAIATVFVTAILAGAVYGLAAPSAAATEAGPLVIHTDCSSTLEEQP